MKVNIVLDLDQYQWVMVPLIEEFSKRGHPCIVSHTREDTEKQADISIGMQDIAWQGREKVRPRFFINHGVSAAKSWNLNIDIDYFVAQSDYWADGAEIRKHENNRTYDILSNTGWPKMDFLHGIKRDREAIRASIYDHFKLDPKKKLVLCFPTYKKKGGKEFPWDRSIRYFEVYEALRKEYNVFVLPHKMDTTTDFDEIRETDRVIYFQDIRRLHFQIASDLIVSDVSGIAFESCGMDTPVVLLHPSETAPRLENRVDLELLTMGPWVTDVPTLLDCTDNNLKNPELFAWERKYWSDKILGPVDGLASTRIVDHIERIVGGTT